MSGPAQDMAPSLQGHAYAKMNGLGNEILLLDLRGAVQALTPSVIRVLCSLPELAFDQLMTLEDPHRRDARAFVSIYNADGTESAACGNGSRCVAWFLNREKPAAEIAFETRAGLLVCQRMGPWRFAIDMGRPKFAWDSIPLAAPVADTRAVPVPIGVKEDALLGPASLVNVGNPHAVFWVDDFERLDVASLGPRLERHSLFPERANISFAKPLSRDHIELKVWERGAGLTRACGTAACAAATAAVRTDRCDRICRVSLPGGDLDIEWRADDHVIMSGPCELEHEGALGATLEKAQLR